MLKVVFIWFPRSTETSIRFNGETEVKGFIQSNYKVQTVGYLSQTKQKKLKSMKSNWTRPTLNNRQCKSKPTVPIHSVELNREISD